MEDDSKPDDLEDIENTEWIESLDYVIQHGGSERTKRLLRKLQLRASEYGIALPYSANTPYVNTIVRKNQAAFPGNREIEHHIKSIIRWNAMAMVVRANQLEAGIGGHISTYASAATLYEVGFNHFFKGKDHESGGDQIYFQGHASPGIYSRAFLEGRISQTQLENFRRELKEGGGLPSYPHPYLMPGFWEFPTVSMGLGPLTAIYQARFNRYLEDRGLKERTGKVWAFVGDGETDEPEALGAISLAAREHLDNLIFVINCNLQRLDGPVRGNGKIIQELEAGFRGAGWNVIKVIWGNNWDPLLEQDKDGILVQRMEEALDGDYQKYSTEDPSYIRDHFFGKYPKLAEMVSHLSNDDLFNLKRGGHDPEKVYAAFYNAVNHTGSPTVILAKTVKGYGMGEAGEGKNITHQQKKLTKDELKEFRHRFEVPIAEDEAGKVSFYMPARDSEEIKYLLERRKVLGGFVPSRRTEIPKIVPPANDLYHEFYQATEAHDASTTMMVVRLLGKILRDPSVGKYIVPIIPDEARTFGMETLFRQFGIYSHVGQKYEPVDRDTLLYYREEKWGQILEEGITEAGSLSSFICAGTAYATHDVPTIPFFLFYSMFGFQRIGDLVWAAGDIRARGFLIGGTAGRTTLAGEGLQHQDGHSHLVAFTYPHVISYDPAFSYEIAVIIEDGLNSMFKGENNHIRYITVGNESYHHFAAPRPIEELREGILKGMYKFSSVEASSSIARVQLFGSGSLLNETINAAKILSENFSISSDIWSITSYKQLFTDAAESERLNLVNDKKMEPYVVQMLKNMQGPVVAVTDYIKAIPLSIAKWVDRPYHVLGTDGFGRSESRSSLRDFFEVSYKYIVLCSLKALADDKKIKKETVEKARADMEIDSSKFSPLKGS